MVDLVMLADYEMLESLYNFNATFTKTLTFGEGERFLRLQTSSKHRNWWQVINQLGEVGFVPSNYVSTIQVEPETMITFLDDCLKSLNSESPIPSQKKDLIARLKEKKRHIQMLLKAPSKKPPAPQPPEVSPLSPVFDLRPIVSEQNMRENVAPDKDQHDITVYHTTVRGDRDEAKSLPSKSSEHIRSPHASLSSPTASKDEYDIIKQNYGGPSGGNGHADSEDRHNNGDLQSDLIHPNAIYKIVQSVREKTQLSHELSKVAVETVLISLREFLPGGAACSIVDALLLSASSNVTCPASAIHAAPDALRMMTALGALSQAANDAQQRGWSLHDDAHDIQTQLLELISVMSNADVNISQHVLSSHKYAYVTTLVQYYQMETRWPLRQLLLQAFGVMCGLERTALATLAVSPLPAEIARDMMDNPRAVTRLSHSALLLSMVLSMADKLPVTHFEQLGVEFAQFLLELMESPPETDVDEQIPDLFLTLLLAYNLQFSSPHDNLLLDALQSRDTAKTFTEKVLLLLNREDDPVRIFDHEPAPPHSVLKLVIDLFQRRPTADHFYTNDVRVMIDIVVRNLADLSAGDTRREKYLQLCGGIVRNTDYGSHLHRREDLLRCFARIFCEESEASRTDQALCRAISNEFPHYFKGLGPSTVVGYHKELPLRKDRPHFFEA